MNDLVEKLNLCLDGLNRKNEQEISDYILEKYNWDEVVSKTEKLYKK